MGAVLDLDVVVTDRLGRWAPGWDRLVAAAPLPSPFLRSWWLGAAAEGEPCLVLVLDGDRLAGGLALQRDHVLGVERLGLLGSGALCPDHLDLVAEPGSEVAVAGALAAWLRRPGARIVALEGLAESHRLALAPSRAAGVAPFVDLGVDERDWLASRPGRLRHALARHGARLRRLGAAHRAHADAASGLATYRRLHEARFGARSGLLPRFDAFAAAVRAGAAAGEVAFHELAVDGQAVACEVTFEVAGRASFYQSGRLLDPAFAGAGTVLKAAVVDHYRRLGFTEYDLLRGDEPYKQDWATGSRPLLALDLRAGARARVARRLGAA